MEVVRRVVLALALSQCVAGWSRDMPGGMKIGIGGKTYGFTTDLCPGGIFFKKPVDLDFMCTHGYFLRRSNGCRMHGNDVVSGSQYVCTDNIKKSVQAFISLTNPSAPLEHTIAFFDDADKLENFRRYTYSTGLEDQYQEDAGAEPLGVIVSNPSPTPLISIGNLCYQGKSSSGSAYIVKLPKDLKDGESNGFFVKKCSAQSIQFPWSKAHHYDFTQGYSSQLEFKNEITASLPAETFLEAGPEPSHYEIWNGLAICLQGNQVEGKGGKLIMNGITPSISTLKPLCHSHKGHSRKSRSAPPPMEILEGTALARIARANGRKEGTENPPGKGRRAKGGVQGRAAAGDAGGGGSGSDKETQKDKNKDSSESEETAEPPESALLGCVMSCNGQAMNKIPPMFAARQFSMG